MIWREISPAGRHVNALEILDRIKRANRSMRVAEFGPYIPMSFALSAPPRLPTPIVAEHVTDMSDED